MVARSNVSYRIPVSLSEQITGRAKVNGRSRNEEVRSLVFTGLGMVEDRELIVELPEDTTKRSVVWLDHEVVADVKHRAKRFHRDLSIEITLLIAYALQKIVDRDLATLREMMSRAGQEAPSH